jgi:hypothetical protein
MTRILRSARLALAAAVVACAALTSLALALVPATGPVGAVPSGGTALPPGWELCVLQGLSAPATQANISDLDAWQAAEGGSTNNSAAYNPYNTRRTTDVNNAPLPATISSNGFPAFANWLAGCSATVATLLQPNMWSITAALRAGTVAPPGAFLAAVDQSQWCAPTNGVPCYADAIMGAAGQLAPALLTESSALQVFGSVQLDLHAYQQDVSSVAKDQSAVVASQQELLAAETADTAAQAKHAGVQKQLEKFAIEEYVSSGLYVTSLTSEVNATGPTGGESPDGVVAQEYTKIAASDLVARDQAAEQVLRAAQARRDAAFKSVGKATALLISDDAAETHALAQLVSEVGTMQNAGACTTVDLTASGTPAATGPGSSGTTTTTTTTTTLPPAPTTTTSTEPPPTTTTTTVPPSTTTTTLLSPSVPSGGLPTSTTTTSSTTTTTTLPPAPTTTTSTVPPTTTTTTTAPPAAANGGTAAAPQTASPAGLGALQGCIATFVPSGSA